ncbi:MAG: type III polyketide synthase [Minwuia sp.]|uniref:type III polyketide synthase n=1 Tax=Minwuia sp. TaxID=2493630 RepID=UPI003A86C8A9
MRKREPLARIAGLSVANPPHVLHQKEVAERAGELFGDSLPSFGRLRPVYENAEIETRYSCVPITWYQEQHGFGARNELYLKNAVELLEQAALSALNKCGRSIDEIDGIVTVSSSGIATPSLDALLMERMSFRRSVQRLPVFGLGCAGGVLGLARAAQMAASRPGSLYLFLVVELCGLTFRSRDFSKSNVIATALFGDGAAAALVGTGIEGDGAIVASGEHTWPGTLDVMGWDVTDDGLAVVFSRDIPHHVRTKMREALDGYLAEEELTLAEHRHFLCHPGGAKVLDALEEIFDLDDGEMRHSRETLRSFGNMSAATVMFVLEAAIRDGLTGRALLSSLGPGFTAGFLSMDLT